MTYNKLVPELSVTNINKSLEFYVNIIGFKIEYERKEDKFAYLSINGAEIMIEEINGNWSVGKLEYPFGCGINLQIDVENIDQIQSNLLKNNIKPYKEIFESTYKVKDELVTCKELLVQDPDGYLLRFAQ